jgi:hypothetical protein
MQATRIRPTPSFLWPDRPLSVPRPVPTSDVARQLYTNRLTVELARWAEEERLAAERKVSANRKRADGRKARRERDAETLDERMDKRQDTAERED